MDWVERGVCATRFEDLVAPSGARLLEARTAAIAAIASYVGAPCPPEHGERIADSTFGDTATFHKGHVGAGRDVFELEHREVAKELLNDLLFGLGYEQDGEW